MPTSVFQSRAHGIEAHDCRGKSEKARPVCGECKKDFGRPQERKRHIKDVHNSPRKCPFCDIKWKRCDKIKAHLLAKHRERFIPEIVEGLRGRDLTEFLDHLTEMETIFQNQSRSSRGPLPVAA
ncbi:hypothetical protein F5148DRAFT_458369 [Russula earlei]|uniref:Uncharacterized protein n=1 Tax=Russula earlei TaxID=71964 RepID=A0ACC0TZE8_9AGAM|nr:hypothetical protein F5148DRAFT_458369 [Russula earlei]